MSVAAVFGFAFAGATAGAALGQWIAFRFMARRLASVIRSSRPE